MSCIRGIDHISFSENNTTIVPHSHQNIYQILFIIKGHAHVRIDDKYYHVTRPTAIFINTFETHSFEAESKDFSRFCISLSPALIRQDLKNDRLLSIISNRPENFCHCIDIEPISHFIETLLWEILKEVNSDFKDYTENASSLLRCIFVALYRHSPKSFPLEDNNISSTIQKVKQKIETNLSSEQTLDELAAEFHISRYYLAHTYKQITGYSIKNYRMLCRIAEARELLTNTSLSVSRISESIGFPDTSNFSKYFKKKTGYTPSQYRSIHKGETK